MLSGASRTPCRQGRSSGAPHNIRLGISPPTAIIFFSGKKNRKDRRHGERPANDNYRVQSGRDQHSFADSSPAEIVVVKRQK